MVVKPSYYRRSPVVEKQSRLQSDLRFFVASYCAEYYQRCGIVLIVVLPRFNGAVIVQYFSQLGIR